MCDCLLVKDESAPCSCLPSTKQRRTFKATGYVSVKHKQLVFLFTFIYMFRSVKDHHQATTAVFFKVRQETQYNLIHTMRSSMFYNTFYNVKLYNIFKYCVLPGRLNESPYTSAENKTNVSQECRSEIVKLCYLTRLLRSCGRCYERITSSYKF